MLGVIIAAVSPRVNKGSCGVVDNVDVVVERGNDLPSFRRQDGSKGGEDTESVLLTSCC